MNLLLVDGNNLTHRAFHSSNQGGGSQEERARQVANRLAATVTMAANTHGSDRIVVAIDGGGDALGRLAMYPNYKARRRREDADRTIINATLAMLPERIARIRGAITLEIPGYESDDTLATLAALGDSRCDRSIIFSGDKDVLQALSLLTSVRVPENGGGYTIITPSKFLAKHNYHHGYLPTYKALAGDSSDSLSGVPLIGPKHATELICSFGDLDGIYDNLDRIKLSSVRARLEQHRELAYTCLAVATISRNVPISATDYGRIFIDRR